MRAAKGSAAPAPPVASAGERAAGDPAHAVVAEPRERDDGGVEPRPAPSGGQPALPAEAGAAARARGAGRRRSPRPAPPDPALVVLDVDRPVPAVQGDCSAPSPRPPSRPSTRAAAAEAELELDAGVAHSLLPCRLHQLSQHPAERLGVHERHAPEDAVARVLVDQVAPPARRRSSSAAQVVHAVGDVVHALAALGQEPPDRRVLGERREQLDAAALAEPQRERVDALLLDPLARLDSAAPNSRS